MEARKEAVSRNDLKNNFLKKIVLRFDHSGITESELEAMTPQIKELLLKKGYNRFNEELATEMDFQMDDPELVVSEGLPVKAVRRQKVYVFHCDDKRITLRISPVFAFVSITNSQYIDFSEYSQTLLEVVNLISNTPFFTATRFGIRKINQCILKRIDILNNYFEPCFYRLYSFGGKSQTKLFSAKDCLMVDRYNINISRTVLLGELNRDAVYQVILDSDIYVLDDELITELIAKNDHLNSMNDI